jgi:hypothetical protein
VTRCQLYASSPAPRSYRVPLAAHTMIGSALHGEQIKTCWVHLRAKQMPCTVVRPASDAPPPDTYLSNKLRPGFAL